MPLMRHWLNEATRGRMTRRELLGRAAAAGISAGLASSLLSSALRAAGPERGGHLRVGVGGGATSDSLDPAQAASTPQFTVLRSWGQTLLELSPLDGGLIPVLALDYRSDAAALTWTFTIRKGVAFQNGKVMTPEDVVATLVRHADPASKSGALGLLEGVERIEARGQDVVIALKSPNVDLPYFLTDYHLMIQPNGGRDDPTAAVGTGNYRLAAAEPGSHYTFERFKDAWRQDAGYVDSGELLVMNEAGARADALVAGKVHVIGRLDPKAAIAYREDNSAQVFGISGAGHYMFAMHCDKEPFANADLRMALKLAIDREQMVKVVLRGFGTVGNDFPIGPTYPLYPDGIEQRSYDPEKAAFHYKRSGHTGPIQLRTSEAAFPGAGDAATLLQQSAAKAGMIIQVRREPVDGYWTDVWNRQPFCATYWGGRPVQDQMYATAYLSSAPWNDTHWYRPEFDKLLLMARGETDTGKRKDLYRQMAVMVRDDGGAIIPMFNEFIEGAVAGVTYIPDRQNELSNGAVMTRSWFLKT